MREIKTPPICFCIVSIIAIVLIFQYGLVAQYAENPVLDLDDSIEDISDGLDLGNYLFEKGGILPIPIVISDPAVGYGAGLIGVKFHQKPDPKSKQKIPPSVSFAGGFQTESDSWAALVGHFHSWNDDDIRYTGAVGMGKLNLVQYLFTNEGDGLNLGIPYSLESKFTLQGFTKRTSTNTTLGISYLYLGTDVGLDFGSILPGLDPLYFDSDIGGLSVKFSYDTRDNTISPTKGIGFDIKPFYSHEYLGSNYEYWKLDYAFTAFYSFAPFTIGFRVEGGVASDKTPFYHLPFVKQRGVPSMRYQGTNALATEIEFRWAVSNRWTLLTFFGEGFSEFDLSNLTSDHTVEAYGLGFRYLLSEELGLAAGLDYAESEGVGTLYLTVGSAW